MRAYHQRVVDRIKTRLIALTPSHFANEGREAMATNRRQLIQ